MRATGIVRQVDALGRVVIPMELRRMMGINERDPMEFLVDNDGHIVLRKYQPGCVLCGSLDDVIDHPTGKKVCRGCLKVS